MSFGTTRNRDEASSNDGELGKKITYACARGNPPSFYFANSSFSTQNVHVSHPGGNERKMFSKTR